MNHDQPKPALLLPLLVALVLWASLVLKLNNLGHSGLTRWDEVYHAVVARNVLEHSWTPTLVEHPYLPYDRLKWGESHVWLHKPILTFWQIALSFALFGVSAFTLRLPSALLSTGAAWLTYLIGKELVSRPAAALAAVLQALSPFLFTLVHGYQFADHVDIALLFWVEVGIFFVLRAQRTGSRRDIILAGAAQGLAFLCKSYLAGIVSVLALVGWLLPWYAPTARHAYCWRMRRFAAMLGTTAAVALPWTISCMIRFPDVFWHEEIQIWQHLSSNIENWAAPWDRVVFDYLIAMYGVFYTPILVAAISLAPRAVLEKQRRLLLALAWMLAVLLPHLFATTKTPSATLIAMPACFLLLGQLVTEAWRGDRWALANLAAVLFMSIVVPATIREPGHGYPPGGTLGVLRSSLWVVQHVGGAMTLASLCAVGALVAVRWSPDRTRAIGRYVHWGAVAWCGAALMWLAFLTVSAAWRVTELNVTDPFSESAGRFAHDHLDEDAVLLCENARGFEHLVIMFYADRTCYPLEPRHLDATARMIADAGGAPYIVTPRHLPLALVHAQDDIPLRIYCWQPRR